MANEERARYTVRRIPPVTFVHGDLYVAHDRWMACDVGRPLPWIDVVGKEVAKLNKDRDAT